MRCLGRQAKAGKENLLQRLCFIVYMAWEIWKQRNNWVFERVRSSIEQVCRKVRGQVMERVAMELSGAAARVRWICWTLPPVGVIKANFDVAFRMTDGLQ